MKNTKKYLEKVKITAVIYCRVYQNESKNPEDLLGKQEKALNDFASKNGYVVQKTFLETSQSGDSFDRPQLLKLIEYIKANKWKIKFLIVLDGGRLARNPFALKKLKIFLRLNGVKVVSVVNRMLKQHVKKPKKHL